MPVNNSSPYIKGQGFDISKIEMVCGHDFTFLKRAMMVGTSEKLAAAGHGSTGNTCAPPSGPIIRRRIVLSKPPALGSLGTIRTPIAGDVDEPAFLADAQHPVCKHMNDSAAFIATDFLGLKIHLRALVFIELTPGFLQQFVEALVFPVCVVPFGITGVGRGKHPVDGLATVPVTHHPGFLQPDHLPVTVRRFLDNVDLDAGLGSLFLIEDGLVEEISQIGGEQLEGWDILSQYPDDRIYDILKIFQVTERQRVWKKFMIKAFNCLGAGGFI
jgi:hypothetical protein